MWSLTGVIVEAAQDSPAVLRGWQNGTR